MIASLYHTTRVYDGIDFVKGRMVFPKQVAAFAVLTSADLATLHTAVCKQGRACISDHGGPEHGPDPSYEGHKWGPLLAHFDDPTCVWEPRIGMYYTSEEHLEAVIKQATTY